MAALTVRLWAVCLVAQTAEKKGMRLAGHLAVRWVVDSVGPRGASLAHTLACRLVDWSVQWKGLCSVARSGSSMAVRLVPNLAASLVAW